MHDAIPLHLLLPGQSGYIELVAGPPEQVHRMEELGLRSGVQVEMVQTGAPCIIRLQGTTLCLRMGDLMSVLVRTEMVA